MNPVNDDVVAGGINYNHKGPKARENKSTALHIQSVSKITEMKNTACEINQVLDAQIKLWH